MILTLLVDGCSAQEHPEARVGILELLDKWAEDNPPSDDSDDASD